MSTVLHLWQTDKNNKLFMVTNSFCAKSLPGYFTNKSSSSPIWLPNYMYSELHYLWNKFSPQESLCAYAVASFLKFRVFYFLWIVITKYYGSIYFLKF